MMQCDAAFGKSVGIFFYSERFSVQLSYFLVPVLLPTEVNTLRAV